MHDQTLVGKKADSAVFGVSVVRAVHSILTALSKREEASSGKNNSLVKFLLSVAINWNQSHSRELWEKRCSRTLLTPCNCISNLYHHIIFENALNFLWDFLKVCILKNESLPYDLWHHQQHMNSASKYFLR